MPTAGYSANGNYGTGFRIRLYAQVIYLKSPKNRPVALVQCDLLAGSEPVRRRLAELVAPKTDLDLGGVMISGAHTHSGPSGLFWSNFYLIHAGNEGNFDRRYFDFMVGQIAHAIVGAYNNKGPARIAYGSLESCGFTRNRSIMAYRANKNADPEKSMDIHKAGSPTMHVIRVDCLDERSDAFVPTGAITSFSIHGDRRPVPEHPLQC
jgi:neutral ceramidase